MLKSIQYFSDIFCLIKNRRKIMEKPFYNYIDVDETFVRNYNAKHPIHL